MSLFTIGYEHATLPAVLDALEEAGVRLVVDVRAVTSSRRPGFSKRQFAAALDERGIAYLHLQGLGTPKEGRLAARSGDVARLARLYGAHLATPEAREALDELAAILKTGKPACLLCYEHEPAGCHRRIVTERMKKRLAVTVEDLFPVPTP